jgi:hypothetical protein
MDTFVTTFTAKAGSDQKIADFYIGQQAQYEAAKGFRGRQLLMSRPGTMLAEVSKFMSAEEIASHPAPDSSAAGAHFVIVEQWDSAADRMAYSRSRDKALDRELFPHLLPEHTHEFYNDLTP